MAQQSKLIGPPNSVRVGQMPPPCWANPNFGAHHLKKLLRLHGYHPVSSNVMTHQIWARYPMLFQIPQPFSRSSTWLSSHPSRWRHSKDTECPRIVVNRGDANTFVKKDVIRYPAWFTYEKRWKITIFHGKIHYLDWVIFHSYVKFSEGISHKDLDILDALPYCKNLSKNGLFDQVNLHHHWGHQLRRLGWFPRYNAHPYPGPNDVDICWWLFNHRS